MTVQGSWEEDAVSALVRFEQEMNCFAYTRAIMQRPGSAELAQFFVHKLVWTLERLRMPEALSWARQTAIELDEFEKIPCRYENAIAYRVGMIQNCINHLQFYLAGPVNRYKDICDRGRYVVPSYRGHNVA